jgi:glyoxylase-like metal-dependent hydrolase (beta-lactamase superfamily II)
MPVLKGREMNLNNLTCIDLDQPRLEGFRKFISCWLYQDEGLGFIVDPGPLSTIPHLVSQLHRHGVNHLDYILLTHIHIDHAGGAGALLEHFPDARIICHPNGIPHMIEPEKLWLGSLKVLGGVAEAFGKIIPIPQNRIGYDEWLADSRIHCFLTPGHAPHHLCFLLEDLLFGGEVAGVRSEVADGIYMRPATPPRFMLEVALDSLQRMIALAPRYLVIAHYGLVEPALDYLQIGRQQLRLWVKGVAETASQQSGDRERALFDWLVEHDRNFRNIRQLEADIYARERIFFANTLRGMREYVDGLSHREQQIVRQAAV